jgi:hypothetical protein
MWLSATMLSVSRKVAPGSRWTAPEEAVASPRVFVIRTEGPAAPARPGHPAAPLVPYAASPWSARGATVRQKYVAAGGSSAE